MDTAGRPPDSDDDRTVIRVPARPSAGGSHTLPVGTRIEGFEIVGLIGEGGFGIVYLAYDPALERQVAIKEYMPASLAARSGVGHEVSVKSERHRETFEVGLRSFVNEARLLARFDHPSLVKVFRFWEANRTAYMAMPFYQGPTLKRALAELGGPPPEALLREWLRALLDALAVMHKEQCYHRDIAPDNILLTDRGPLLLDFGAARRVIGDMTHALTVVLKPGYAPIEQYGEASAMVQGPWTDLYALASVVHYAITGKAPITSVERIMGDRLEPLAARAAGRYGAGFLQAIDAALAVKPQDRPQDVAQFRELLNVGLSPDSPDYFRSSGFGHSGFGHSGFHTSGFSPSSFDTVPDSGASRTPARTVHHAVSEPPAERQAEASTPSRPEPARAAPPPRPREPVTAMPPMATRDPEPVPPARVGKGAYVAIALALLAVGATVVYMRTHDGAPAAANAPGTQATAAPAPPAASASLPPAPMPAPAPAAVVQPPAVVVAPAPAEIAPAPPAATPAPAVEAPAPAPVVEAAPPPVAPPPVARRVEPAPRPAPEAKRATPKTETAEPAPSRSVGGRPARCSDILQKASLEPLTAEETAFLKRECR